MSTHSPTITLPFAAALAVTTIACHPSPNDGKEALADNKPAVDAKLKRLATIAAEVKKAPSPGPSARLNAPSPRPVMRSYRLGGYQSSDRSGPVESPEPSNTLLIELPWLLDWRAACHDSIRSALDQTKRCEDNARWSRVEWFVEMASLAETGHTAFGSDPAPTDYIVEMALGRFLSTRYVLVDRDDDLFFYEIDTGKALGSTHFDPSHDGGSTEYVYVDGPRAGQVTYSADSSAQVRYAEMNELLLEQLPNVVVSSPR